MSNSYVTFVNMGGIDLAEANCTVVEGLYDRLVTALEAGNGIVLFNWGFSNIMIPPSHCQVVQLDDEIRINELIQVTELDEVTVLGIEPPPPPLEPVIPLEVTENGVYEIEEPQSGYNPVTVDVPIPEPLVLAGEFYGNGIYYPPEGYDGYSSVVVNVPSSTPVISPLSINANGIYTAPTGVDGYSPITVSVGEDWINLKNYIESSGTQYINSGYAPTENTKFEVIADVPDNSTNYPTIIGERTVTSNEIVIYTEFSGGNLGLIWANGDGAVTTDSIRQDYIGQKCKYVLSSDGLRCVLNENGYGFLSEKAAGDNFATLPIFIFALNDGGSPNSVTFCTAKLYRLRIYESNVLVREYLPWQENGVACLKDTVTGNIFYNSGTGSFVYGTDQ